MKKGQAVAWPLIHHRICSREATAAISSVSNEALKARSRLANELVKRCDTYQSIKITPIARNIIVVLWRAFSDEESAEDKFCVTFTLTVRTSNLDYTTSFRLNKSTHSVIKVCLFHSVIPELKVLLFCEKIRCQFYRK